MNELVLFVYLSFCYLYYKADLAQFVYIFLSRYLKV